MCVCVYVKVNENRYEGVWKDGQKHGPGRFWFRDQGQLYEGFWVDGVAKCGTVCDFGREQAATPTLLPLPQVSLTFNPLTSVCGDL